MHSEHDAIRQAACRYSQGVDRLDLATMQSAYWPDATDDHGVYVGEAMPFCEMVVRSHARYLSTMHCVLNHTIDIGPSGHDASGEVYVVTYLHRAEGDTTVLDTWYGRYLDTYSKRGDEWRIAHRICVHEFTTSAPVAATMPIDASRFRQGSEDRGK